LTDLKERGCFGKTAAEVKIILKGLCRCELGSLVSERVAWWGFIERGNNPQRYIEQGIFYLVNKYRILKVII
jgi:hypothetical protein